MERKPPQNPSLSIPTTAARRGMCSSWAFSLAWDLGSTFILLLGECVAHSCHQREGDCRAISGASPEPVHSQGCLSQHRPDTQQANWQLDGDTQGGHVTTAPQPAAIPHGGLSPSPPLWPLSSSGLVDDTPRVDLTNPIFFPFSLCSPHTEDLPNTQ